MRGLWANIKKPVFVLAPMANVTDAAFRRVIAKYGKPDVMWTEFVSADGLVYSEQSRKRLLIDLLYHESERPIIAQLFGSDPKKMQEATQLVHELGFDGVDLNMGCPDKAVVGQGAGAALIKTPLLAQQIINACKKAVVNFPVSVKTRIGYDSADDLTDWIRAILDVEPDVLTVHLRTKKELSLVPAHWTSDIVGNFDMSVIRCIGVIHSQAKVNLSYPAIDSITFYSIIFQERF
jgi:tRNA-dihydrouridine synthase